MKSIEFVNKVVTYNNGINLLIARLVYSVDHMTFVVCLKIQQFVP